VNIVPLLQGVFEHLEEFQDADLAGQRVRFLEQQTLEKLRENALANKLLVTRAGD